MNQLPHNGVHLRRDTSVLKLLPNSTKCLSPISWHEKCNVASYETTLITIYFPHSGPAVMRNVI